MYYSNNLNIHGYFGGCQQQGGYQLPSMTTGGGSFTYQPHYLNPVAVSGFMQQLNVNGTRSFGYGAPTIAAIR